MSRDIRRSTVRPNSLDSELQHIDREQGRLLITSCPIGLRQNRQQSQEKNAEQNYIQGTSPQQFLLLAALIRQDRLVAVHSFSPGKQSRIGAVYLGKIKRIVKNLNACFVEIAGQEQCFLHLDRETDPPFLTNRTYDGRLLREMNCWCRCSRRLSRLNRLQ